MRWILALSICALAACRHPAYTLARQGRTQILTPPPTKPEIKGARQHPPKTSGCDVASGPFSLTWRGNTALVAAKAEEYYAPPAEQPAQPNPTVAIQETGPRMYADSLADIEKFRDGIAAKQEAGCLRVDESARLRQRMTEIFPFPPQIATYLRFGTYTQTGFVDLNAGSLLSVMSPIEGGFDISIYAASNGAESDRVRITHVSGMGKALTVPESTGYFRYLYWTGASPHNFRATILGAGERATLRQATAKFLDDPEGYCAKPEAGVFCEMIAPSVGMNAGFSVRVKGRETFSRVGGTVGEAVTDPASHSRTLPKIASVRRLYHGKLVPVKFEGNEIFGLVLMPGDEITY
ncbi:MAG TPA: hypothetical protein VMT15_13800 [Bryobacteraceae bacterium]|nr:hypothetical protein [Bryobacteraceae bacterium]